MPLDSSTIIEKRPDEKILVGMDFGPWLSSGETISSCNSVSIDGNIDSIPTATSPTISGSRVLFFIENGLSGHRYIVEVTITTSSGQILIGEGPLKVI